MTHDLHALFHPRCIAVVGASTDPYKFGGMPVHYTKKLGFKGRLCPVNPRADMVQGLPSFPSVSAIDGDIDCAVVSVPAPAVIDAITQCAEKGVRIAAVFSSSFAEAGPEGKRAQDEMVHIARQSGMRILGPNCMGAFCLDSGIFATFTSAFEHHDGAGAPNIGHVSIASQSGAIGTHIMVLLRERGIGISKWVTTGNQSDIDIADCIAYFADDPETRVIVTYMEGCPDGAKLMRSLDSARRAGKPVIVIKVGTTEAGAAAAASHTASLAGSDAVVDAALRQSGAWRADSLIDLVDMTAAANHGKFPARPDVGLITISGGVGVLMADAATNLGLRVPPMPKAGQKKLLDLEPLATARNPIDTAAMGMRDMNMTARYVDIVLEDGGYPTVIVFVSHLGMVERHYGDLKAALAPVRAKFPERIIVLVITASPETRRSLEADGYMICEDPTQAVESIAALWRIGSGFPRGKR
jgi:acetate---CoA ligase (ADP-forming)